MPEVSVPNEDKQPGQPQFDQTESLQEAGLSDGEAFQREVQTLEVPLKASEAGAEIVEETDAELPALQAVFQGSFAPVVTFFSREQLAERLPDEAFRQRLAELHFFNAEIAIDQAVLGADLQQSDSQEETAARPSRTLWSIISRPFKALAKWAGNFWSSSEPEKEPIPQPTEQEMFIEKITAHPSALNAHLTAISEFVDQLKADYSKEPTRQGYALLVEANIFLEGQKRILDSTSYKVKDFDALKIRLKEICEGELKELSKGIDDLLAAAERYDWAIDALAVLPEREVRRALQFDFTRKIEAHFRDIDPQSINQQEVESFKRLMAFLRHIKRFEEAPPAEEPHRLLCRHDRFVGAELCYGVMMALSHTGYSWILTHPALRPILAPLLEEARQEYLEDADRPLAEAARDDRASVNRAMFVETALIYEREALRTEALSRGSLASLIGLSFSWGHETCTEKTGEAAGRLLCQAASQIKTRLLESPYASAAHLDFELRHASHLCGGIESQDIETLTRTLMRISTRGSAQFTYANRHFLRNASQEQLEIWLAVATGHEADMAKYDHPQPLRRLLQCGVDLDVLRTYIGRAGREIAEAPLEDLFGKLDKEQGQHLLRIGGENVKQLNVLAKQYNSGEGWREANLSREEIMAAQELAPLLKRLQVDFRDKIAASVKKTVQRATAFRDSVQLENGKSYTDGRISAIETEIDRLLDRIFAGEITLTPEELEGKLNSERFAEVLSGVRDIEMMLPAASAEQYLVSSAAWELGRLFPQGLFIPAEEQQASSDLLEQRVKVQTELFARLSEVVPVLAGKDRLETAQALAEDFWLREEAWTLISSADFAERHTCDILNRAGRQIFCLKVRVAAKSEPDTWSLPIEVSHVLRKDAALLVVEYNGETVSAALFMAADRKTLLLTHLPEPESAPEESRGKIKAALADFLGRYASALGISYLIEPAAGQAEFERVVIGPVYSGRFERRLPEAEEIKPLGDSPQTAGQGLLRQANKDYRQRVLWEKAQQMQA